MKFLSIKYSMLTLGLSYACVIVMFISITISIDSSHWVVTHYYNYFNEGIPELIIISSLLVLFPFAWYKIFKKVTEIDYGNRY